MPEVLIKAKVNWYPSEDPHPHEVRDNLRQLFTFWLGSARIQGVIAETLNEFDPPDDDDPTAKPTAAGSVVVDYDRAHRHVQENVPDIWIKVILVHNATRVANKRKIRNRLLSELAKVWAEFELVESHVEAILSPPQIDVDIVINEGCGASLKRDMTVSSFWPN